MGIFRKGDGDCSYAELVMIQSLQTIALQQRLSNQLWVIDSLYDAAQITREEYAKRIEEVEKMI